jgi:hypothetical protein
VAASLSAVGTAAAVTVVVVGLAGVARQAAAATEDVVVMVVVMTVQVFVIVAGHADSAVGVASAKDRRRETAERA